MAFSIVRKVDDSVVVGGATYTSRWQTTYTSTGGIEVDESIANGQTDKLVEFALDVSACKAFWIMSDKNVTVETNDGTTPGNTLTLVAGKEYFWAHDGFGAFLLTVDVTALYVTNSSGAAARLQVAAVYDATP